MLPGRRRDVREWDDLVTTALLGTDRRLGLPASALLDEAAQHRAVRRSSTPLQRCEPCPRGPEPERAWPPPAARDLLDGLLARPVAELVNGWLAACVEARVLLAPQHWAPLASLAATRPDYDRRLLAGALGRSGLWFLEQNPAWRGLAATVGDTLRQPSARSGAQDSAGPTGGPGQVPGEAEVRARPEAAFEVPGPWPRSLGIAALRALLSGQLGWRAAAYGSALGVRLAVGDADLLQQASDALPGAGRGAPPGVRFVRDGVDAAIRSVQVRQEIAGAFAPASVDRPPPSDPPDPSTHPRSEDPDGRA